MSSWEVLVTSSESVYVTAETARISSHGALVFTGADDLKSARTFAPGEWLAVSTVPETTACARCGKEIAVREAEHCWGCGRFLCLDCWYEPGHCGCVEDKP